MCAVAVPVAYACCLVNEIIAVDIILVTVCIVVGILYSIGLKFVGPDVACKVGVSCVDTCIDDCNNRTLVGYLVLCPYILEINSVERPLLLEERFFLVLRCIGCHIVGNCSIDKVVGLGILNLSKLLELFHRIVDRDSRYRVETQTVEL